MIRAIAIATESSDLVGTVELACEDDGLALGFVRASGFAVAYAPTPPIRGGRIVVPYRCIKELSDDGDALRIHIDSKRVPHHRLILTHLTRDQRVDHTTLNAKRVRGELLVAAGAAVLVGLSVPLASLLGTGAAALVGAFTTFSAITGALVIGQGVARRAMLGGPNVALERRVFFDELRRHLPESRVLADEALSPPIRPALVVARAQPAPFSSATFGPSPGPTETSAGESRLADLWPMAGGVAAAALLGLVALFGGARFLAGEPATAEQPAEVSRPAAATQPTLSAPVPPPAAEPLETCLCQAPASPAIPTRVPRVTILSSIVKQNRDPKRPSLTVEVAAVNNGAEPVRQIAGAVTFLAPGRKPDDPLRVTRDRGLFYEGPLAAGAAVKWRVGARGTGYRVALNDERLLDEATLAGPDAFAQLLSANTRSVRVHGAAMLTRMRDERAAPAIDKLREEARDEEAATLASLARAAAAVYTCEVVVTPSASGKGSASVCVMNTSDTAQGPLRAVLTLTRRASKATPADDDRAVSSMPLGRAVTIPAKSGVRVHGAAEVAAAALTEVVTEVVVEHER